MQSAENRFRDDSMTITNLMVAGHWRDAVVRRVGNAWTKARVRTPAIVMSDPLLKYVPHVALIQRNHDIESCEDRFLP